MSPTELAQETFTNHLKNNSYPGRGLCVGRMDNGTDWVIVYFIMGRSENSRNRRFAFEGERLWTEPVDESKVEDPSLIIYDAMLALSEIQLVSNGDQTTTVHNALSANGSFQEALATRDREPDAPNFTPRISGMIDFRSTGDKVTLSILKANRNNSELTDRTTFQPADPAPGFAYGLTTYMGDGSPLPSFAGDPVLLPVHGSAEEILDAYWNALDKDNRVSLAVKQIRKDGNLEKIVVRNCHD